MSHHLQKAHECLSILIFPSVQLPHQLTHLHRTDRHSFFCITSHTHTNSNKAKPFYVSGVHKKISLVPRPCAFVACSTKFAQRREFRTASDERAGPGNTVAEKGHSILPFCHPAILPIFHYSILPFCHSAILILPVKFHVTQS